MCTELLATWIGVTPARSIANLAGAAPYEKGDVVPRVLGQLVTKWITEVKTQDWYERKVNLENIGYAALLIPENVIELIYTYMNEPIPGADPLHTLTLDDYGSLIEVLALHRDYQVEVLNLIKELAGKDLKGTYSNYKPDSLMRSLVSPLRKSPDLIRDALGELTKRCGSTSVTTFEAHLAAVAASEILASAHEYHDSSKKTFTIGERALRCTAEILALRDLGIMIFEKLVRRKDSAALQIAAVGIGESIGKSPMGRAEEASIPLSDRIAQDRAAALTLLRDVPKNCADFRVLSKLENLLFRWWSQQVRGTDGALEILLRMPRPPEYRLFKRYTDPDYVIDDFGALLKQAPKTEVWNWWWEHRVDREGPDERKYIEELAHELSVKYKTADETSRFLLDMDALIGPYKPYPNPPVIRNWAHMDPRPFMELYDDALRWKEVPARFKGQISSALAEHVREHIREVESEVITALPNPDPLRLYDWISLLIENGVPFEKVRDSVMQLATKGDLATRRVLCNLCYSLVKESRDKDPLFELMYQVAVRPVDTFSIGELAFCLGVIMDWPIANQELESRLVSALKSLAEDFEELGPHEVRILKFCLGACRRIRHFGFFVDKSGKQKPI